MKIIKKFVLGICQTNCYLIEHEQKIILVDAGENAEKIVDYCQKNELKIDLILLTHSHFDHIAGLNLLTDTYKDVLVYGPRAELEFLKDPKLTLATDFNSNYTFEKECLALDTLNLLGLEIKYISGHSFSSAIMIFTKENVVFTGDTLFRHSVGRSDFIFGNQEKLLTGIKKHLLTLVNETVVYPGHGFSTTIKEEKNSNPFIG